jgi:thiamine biosynthesis lipoprotein
MNAAVGSLRPDTATEECRRARPLLGTLVEIAARGRDAPAAVTQAFRAVEEVQRLMSYHDPDSELSRINREAARTAVKVSPHTWRVLEAARAFSQASAGLFDITVAPALVARGFLPRHAGDPRPSGQGDWRHVELLPGHRVRLTRRVHLDLGGIAKGYAVDRALDVLRAHGMFTARVNAGGDLRVFGEPQIVHVRRPGSPAEGLPMIEMSESAAATSADYFSARRVRGRWVTPLIDPRTRESCARGRSVTVLAPDCLTADALTKVVHADPGRAPAVLAQFAARALLLEETGGVCRMQTFDCAAGNAWRVRWLPLDAPHA